MSRYSKIQSTIWTSEKFNAAKEYSRIVYMYLLSCPHGNSAGFYRLPEGYAITDLRCSQQRYRAALEDLKNVGLIDYDGEVIFIRQFLKFNAYANSNHAKGSQKEIAELETSPLYELFYADVKTFCEGYRDCFPEPKTGIETVSKQSRNSLEIPITITNTNTNTNTNTDISCAEQSAPQSVPQPVITLTLNDNSEYPVMQKQVDEWKELYPAVDVMQQLRNMRGWLLANTTRRKTRTGINRFITSWLSKEQDKRRAPTTPPRNDTPDDSTLQKYANAWRKNT